MSIRGPPFVHYCHSLNILADLSKTRNPNKILIMQKAKKINKQALLRRRPSGNCEKKIAESHLANLVV